MDFASKNGLLILGFVLIAASFGLFLFGTPASFLSRWGRIGLAHLVASQLRFTSLCPGIFLRGRINTRS